MKNKRARALPDPWDIIIRRQTSPVRFIVGPNTDVPQVTCQAYDKAMALAKRFAAKHRVDLWFADAGARCVRVATYRRNRLSA